MNSFKVVHKMLCTQKAMKAKYKFVKDLVFYSASSTCQAANNALFTEKLNNLSLNFLPVHCMFRDISDAYVG